MDDRSKSFMDLATKVIDKYGKKGASGAIGGSIRRDIELYEDSECRISRHPDEGMEVYWKPEHNPVAMMDSNGNVYRLHGSHHHLVAHFTKVLGDD